MYEAFFSLDDAPFVLTPDPRFLLRSKRHHEVLSTLIYGITSQKGLMLLVGDVGTGKTLLCRALLRELPADVRSALVLNPYLSDTEILSTILDDLGVERGGGGTKGELMATLGQYLLAAGAESKTVVVILDEAQQMSQEALEQIRILSTLETATRKLLQIVLVGQPELEEKLGMRGLRQLDQRVAIRCRLEPLSKKETFRYIEHRLRIAGLPGALPFARGALARIYQRSRGIPRVINLVCDRALTAAFNARAREVTPALVMAAIRNLEGHRARTATLGRSLWLTTKRAVPAGFGVAAVLVLGVVAATAYRSGWSPGGFPAFARAPASPQSMASVTLGKTAPALERTEPASRQSFPDVGPDALKGVVARVLRLWGVNKDLSGSALAAWPTTADGLLDVSAVAGHYQLAATLLPATDLAELRAVDLPAVVELGSHGPRLLRRIDASVAVLVSASGEATRLSLSDLEAAWSRSAWIIWPNVDLLPSNPNEELSPIVVSTIGLRLQKLGFLQPPIPVADGERFQDGVRRFQRSMGLDPDGVVGPRTTLALSRVIAGRFGPTLSDASTR